MRGPRRPPPPSAAPSRRRRGRRTAFTLLELLVAIGIVVLLASLIIVALGGVSDAANRTDSINALRSMITGFTAYSTDHKQRLMPGYVDAAGLEDLGISPRLASGSPLDPALESDAIAADPNDASAYVWRLAPYLDHNWQIFMTDCQSQSLETRLDLEIIGADRRPCNQTTAPVYGPGSADAAGCDDVGISRVPSFGMNSIFVGGDNVHGGTWVTERNPWTPVDPREVLAATRLSEVKNPARLVVFAPARSWDDLAELQPAASDVIFGAAELRPPFLNLDTGGSGDPLDWVWTDRQWEVRTDGVRIVAGDSAFESPGSDSGVPVARWGNLMPAAHLDGSVGSRELGEYSQDMRFWAPNVTSQHKTAP